MTYLSLSSNAAIIGHHENLWISFQTKVLQIETYFKKMLDYQNKWA